MVIVSGTTGLIFPNHFLTAQQYLDTSTQRGVVHCKTFSIPKWTCDIGQAGTSENAQLILNQEFKKEKLEYLLLKMFKKKPNHKKQKKGWVNLGEAFLGIDESWAVGHDVYVELLPTRGGKYQSKYTERGPLWEKTHSRSLDFSIPCGNLRWWC